MNPKLSRTVFPPAFVFLLLNLSSAKRLTCSVTRWRVGDRILFVDYNHYGICNARSNPCKGIDGSVWEYSTRGCTCQCSSLKSTYREDKHACVVNRQNRDGCNLLFKGEKYAHPLRIFNNASSIKLNNIESESCEAKETYYVTEKVTQRWKQLQSSTPAFYIRHENRKPGKHAHFLEWKNGQPVTALFGKIVKVIIECGSETKPDDRKKPPENLCIVFKVKGSVTLPCPVGNLPSPTPQTSAVSTVITSTVPTSTVKPSKTRQSKETTNKPFIDTVTIPVEPNRTPTNPLVLDNGKEEAYGGKKIALPIWLIAVIAGGAVIATLAITAIVWICCKMKRRHRRRRRKRPHLGNPLYNNEDDSVITFTSSVGGPGVDPAGYARVGSPGRKGYAFLKPGPERTRSEYQRLVKPGELDHSGYLVPVEERSPTTAVAAVTTTTEAPSTEDSAIYSEAQSPPPQDRPKDKVYDYAKPEDIICLTASRSSLDNLDLHTDTDSGYVGNKNDNDDNGPSSPVYATVEGPSSPGVTSVRGPSEGSPDGTPVENEIDDCKPDYVEVLPDSGSERENALINANSTA